MAATAEKLAPAPLEKGPQGPETPTTGATGDAISEKQYLPTGSPSSCLRTLISGNPDLETGLWLLRGFRAYVAGQGSLEECLGLQSAGPGKPTPRRQLHQSIRNDLVRAVVDMHGGNVIRFLERLHRFETGAYRRWKDGPPDSATEEQRILYLLLDSFEVPRSRAAIYSIVSGG